MRKRSLDAAACLLLVLTTAAECAEIKVLSIPGVKAPLEKLALILHVADRPNERAVNKRTMLKALAWLEYLEPHARRIYHAADAPDADTARLLLARLKRGQVQSGFKAREIYRNGWHGLGDAKHVKAACRLLADYDYLRAIEIEGPLMGRPSDPVYYINPRIKP